MRVLIVEDDLDMAQALQIGLRVQGMVVDTVGNLEAAVAAARTGYHRLILLDRQLPDGDGAKAVANIRRISPSAMIILLTAKASIADRVEGLDCGADDYLTKPFALEELMARVRAVLRRPQTNEIPPLIVGRLRFDFTGRTAYVGEEPLSLPRRQLLLLEALALRKGRTVNREALTEALYGFDESIESNALEAHVSKLRRALSDSSSGAAIHVLRNVGYILKEDPAG